MIKVVAAFIINDNKFLVSKRAHGELKDFWEFPGGKIESNEDINTAIKREIKEELNLNVSPVLIINTFVHKYSFGEIHLTLIKCRLSDNNENINSDGSHTEYKWISIKQSEKLRFAPLDNKIIKYLKTNI